MQEYPYLCIYTYYYCEKMAFYIMILTISKIYTSFFGISYPPSNEHYASSNNFFYLFIIMFSTPSNKIITCLFRRRVYRVNYFLPFLICLLVILLWHRNINLTKCLNSQPYIILYWFINNNFTAKNLKIWTSSVFVWLFLFPHLDFIEK